MGYYSMAHMFETVRNLYQGEKWHRRVDQMSDNQIMAIFYEHLEREEKKRCERLMRENGHDLSGSCEGCGGSTDEKIEYVPRQLSFFD